jgi:hypothetical protein
MATSLEVASAQSSGAGRRIFFNILIRSAPSKATRHANAALVSAIPLRSTKKQAEGAASLAQRMTTLIENEHPRKRSLRINTDARRRFDEQQGV